MATFICNIRLEIGNFELNRVHEVVVVSSHDQLADTCTIKLPTTARLQQEGNNTVVEFAKEFKVGDEVKVYAGYNGEENMEFQGYIKKINLSTPLVVECEDATYFLRRNTLNKSFKNTTLSEILNFVLDGTDIGLVGEVPEIDFEKFVITKASAAQVVQEFIDKYGLSAYITQGTQLLVNYAYKEQRGEAAYNLRNNTVTDDLKYQTKEDIKLKVKATAVLKNNKRIEEEVGDTDGEQRSLFFYNITDKETLKNTAEAKLDSLKYEGYTGTITGFLLPFVQHGAAVEVVDEKYTNREGKYRAEQVTTTLGRSGFRRKVKLGILIKKEKKEGENGNTNSN